MKIFLKRKNILFNIADYSNEFDIQQVRSKYN